MKFNKLTVLDTVVQNKRTYYQVQCDCGRIDLKRKDWVETGRTKMCKQCSAKLTASKYPPPVNRSGCEGLSGTHYTALKAGAKRRNLSFEVSPEFLWQLYLQQHKLCALSGSEIILVPAIKENNVDVSPLHAKGFISIGCAPCTRAVKPGEDIRAGRWWWEQPEQKECGLHNNPNWKGNKK